MVAPAARATSRTDAYRIGSAMLFLATATILGALGFQYLDNQIPCPLCLQQRYAYYAGVPLLFGALVLLSAEQGEDEKPWAALIFLGVSLMFLANAGLAIYQTGAEWKLWAGPATCAVEQPLSATPGDMLKRLQNNVPVRCDAPSWHFLGLSFAGWNVVISTILFFGCLRSARSAAAHGD